MNTLTRFEQKTPLTYAAIAVTMACVFIGDLFTPLGIAVWVFYFVPMALTFLVWRPTAPIWVAAASMLLVIIGFLVSPPGTWLSPGVARVNRVFCVASIWILAGMGWQFIQNKLIVRKQEWLQLGETEISLRMAGDLQTAVLGQKVLGFFADYVHADAGALFAEEGDTFVRVATHGIPSGAKVPEKVTPGDGLLGEAAKTGRIVVVRDVPDGYLVVGSALGQARPARLLIAPAAVGDKVQGLVELGFFTDVDAADEELLLRLSEPIARGIRSAQFRKRLQLLLEQTQQQAEELQTQSEELRVTNEELEEQSRVLRESQARLEQQQTELEATNTTLEEQAERLEAQRDELARAKNSLEAQTRELESASSYKSAFLANMSHELRTPLNSLLILAKLLEDNREGNLTAEQVKYAKTIQSAGNDLLALINDVLDLSKVEAGRLDVQPADVPIAGLVENMRGTFQPLAAERKLVFRTNIDAGVPAKLVTDPQRLEQVLRNLLSNAIKFTERGEVALEISRADDGRVAFAVKDSGIGIASHQQEVIFEPFRQADGSTNRKYGGTGLGLSIAREFVRLLGGEMMLKSAPGEGSTFTVLLPETFRGSASAPTPAMPQVRAKPPAPPPPPPASRAVVEDDRQKLRSDDKLVLVVEDDASFAGIIRDLAHEMGFRVLIAATGEEATALAAQYQPGGVILDIGLPDVSGLSVLDRLKADARTRHIPVHVISASDYTGTAYAMGAAGYFLKPVEREQITEALRNFEVRLSQKVRRVLIVEDNRTQRESLAQLLGAGDVEIVCAGSATECLDQLRTSTFDCMVLDLSLPDRSGFELMEILSREDKYSFPPVIVYTGRQLTADDEQRLRRYSKSIIIKGARSPERLLDEVTLFLHQVVSELPPERRLMIEKARSRDAALEGRHILIVEDDVRNVFALTSILESRGVRLQIARNGQEALSALDRARQPDGTPVELVLMDLMMPEMDGWTAIREIRKRPEWKDLPVIALTAKAMRTDKEEALRAGANDYLPKPLEVEKLLSLVRVWMPR